MLQAAAALAIELPEFTAEQFIQADGSDLRVDAYSVPEVADWNADGLADLIVGEQFSGSQGKVRVYLNTSTNADPVYAAGFCVQAEGADLTVPASGCLGAFPQMMDFNHDGLNDLLIGLADGQVQVRLNTHTNADPQFGPAGYVQVGLPGSTANLNVGARATVEVVDYNRTSWPATLPDSFGSTPTRAPTRRPCSRRPSRSRPPGHRSTCPAIRGHGRGWAAATVTVCPRCW